MQVVSFKLLTTGVAIFISDKVDLETRLLPRIKKNIS